MAYWNAVIQRLDLFAKGAWLVYISGVGLLFLAVLLKKRISWQEWYITVWSCRIFRLDGEHRLLFSTRPA